MEVSKPIAQKLIIKDVIPQNSVNEKANHELGKVQEIPKMLDKESLYHRTNKDKFNFYRF